METDRFDRLTRAVSTVFSRRTLAGALGLAALAPPGLADANKKRKRKKRKKPKFNDFGCVNVGGFCKHDGQCCSGICQGKKCRAHDQDVCQADDESCAGDAIFCTTTTELPGICLGTTGRAGYCYRDATCAACKKDADCVSVCGVGAACVLCADCVEFDPPTACAGLNEIGSCTAV